MPVASLLITSYFTERACESLLVLVTVLACESFTCATPRRCLLGSKGVCSSSVRHFEPSGAWFSNTSLIL